MFKQDLLLLEFNKDVVCIMEQGYSHPDCKVVPSPSRRIEVDVESKVPTYDPYIPRQHALFYNCSALECKSIILYSLTEISNPNLNLRSCFQQGSGKFECEPIRYHYFKNIDKLLFLQSNLENKTFYLVDCFVFQDYSRVCHKKDVNSHADLVKLAAVAKPKEPNSLSQDEFLCEETDTNTDTKAITCDLDPYIPFKDGLKLKDTVKVEGTIVLKTGDYVVGLNRRCFDPWCGYTGQVLPDSVKIPTTKRNFRRFAKYEPPGGAVYRCYYAKRQQVCKLLYNKKENVYNERDWVRI